MFASHARIGMSPLRPTTLLLGLAIGLSCATATVAQETGSTPELRAKVLQQAHEALVQVDLHLKFPTDDESDASGGLGETVSGQTLDRQQENAIRFKMAAHLMGVILSPREVLIPDTAIDPRRMDRWEVTDSTGRKLAARRIAMLRDAPALVLEPTDADAKWSVPTFAPTDITATSMLQLVVPRWSAIDLSWSLSTASAIPTTDWIADRTNESGKPASLYWTVGSIVNRAVQTETSSSNEPATAAFNLIFRTSGELIGVGTADRVSAPSAIPPWRAADLRNAARITEAEMEQLRGRTREQVGPVLFPVRIEFRRPKSLPITIPEFERLGWAVTDHTLLIPGGIPRQFAGWIGKISVQTQGTEVEAEFVGQLKDFDAILIKLPDSADPLAAHSDLTRAGKIDRYRPFIAMTIDRKYGENYLRIDYSRPLGMEFGYGDRPSPRLTPPPSIGSLVLDLDLNPVGLFVRQRRPFEELEIFEQRMQGNQAQGLSSIELFGLETVAKAVADPQSAIDPRIVRRDEKDQDRRVWLGVEFNSLTRELAESIGCRKESKDGTLGLMISQIYAGSPAEKIGLRSGDVLLSLDVPERDRPVRLAPPRGRGGQDLSQLQGGGQGARAPWPSQANYLNNLLGTIGEDTEVKFSFWRDRRLNHLNVIIAQAPPDQDSAAQFKDEGLGITVKEVTYEVRTALRMKPDDPGVVVAKVESGSSAGRARINPFELVQAADGEPIKSVAEFEAIVKKAQEEKKDQLRLTVVDRGRSRFADLKLGQ